MNWYLPRKLILFCSSVIVRLDAPAGMLVTWTYPFWSGFLAKTPDIGRQIEFPHLTLPLFINPEPEITPFFKTALEMRKKKILFKTEKIRENWTFKFWKQSFSRKELLTKTNANFFKCVNIETLCTLESFGKMQRGCSFKTSEIFSIFDLGPPPISLKPLFKKIFKKKI